MGGPPPVRTAATSGGGRAAQLLDQLLAGGPDRAERLTHRTVLESRAGDRTLWPWWAPPGLVWAGRSGGIEQPWQPQAAAAELAPQGRPAGLATGTAAAAWCCQGC